MDETLFCVPNPNHACRKGEGVYLTASYRPEQVKTTRDPAIGHPEGYRIRIQHGEITVESAAPAGEFYAFQTLRQMMHGARALPELCLCDEPVFPYRGFMIDCARHFFTVDELKKMIDAAALYKLNKFHWHLTDDQGWRIQIDSFPRSHRLAPGARDPTLTGKRIRARNTADSIRRIRSARSLTTVHSGSLR